MPTRAVALSSSLRAAFAIVLGFGLLAPAPAFAAKGNSPRVDVSAEPRIDVVSPGQDLAFLASFVNNGPGTITHVRFDGSAPGADFARASAPCTGEDDEVVCELGTLSAGSSVALTIVFKAPSSGEVDFSGSFAGDAGSGNPNSASADVWDVVSTESIVVDASSGFFGAWQEAHEGLKTFQPIQTGPQKSTVTAHATDEDYVAMLRHTGDAITCTNEDDLGGVDLLGFGQALDLDVANGDTAIDVRITYADVDLNPRKVRLVHQNDDGTCTLPPICDGSNDGNCFEAFAEGRGRNRQLVIEAQLPHNGRVKGF
jgi:hypothetical protein